MPASGNDRRTKAVWSPAWYECNAHEYLCCFYIDHRVPLDEGNGNKMLAGTLKQESARKRVFKLRSNGRFLVSSDAKMAQCPGSKTTEQLKDDNVLRFTMIQLKLAFKVVDASGSAGTSPNHVSSSR